jgi:Uncharacterized conserved protein
MACRNRKSLLFILFVVNVTLFSSALALAPPTNPTVSISTVTIDRNKGRGPILKGIISNSNVATDRIFKNIHETNKKLIILKGGSNDNNSAPNNNKSNESQFILRLKKAVLPVIISALVITFGFYYKDAITFDLREEIAIRLDSLAALGTPGVIIYTLAFILWELTVGVTTPVETAAGMAFGLKNGLIANAVGKTSGAILAFLLGRHVLKGFVQKKLEGNELMELVQDSIAKNPIKVALIWRLSFLPEQVKNFGLAVLPVKTWHFIAAIMIHGLPFTLLWTFLGNEMGLIVRGVMDSPSRLLKMLLAGVYVFGFFISPTMVGLWIKSLRDEKMKKEKNMKQK